MSSMGWVCPEGTNDLPVQVRASGQLLRFYTLGEPGVKEDLQSDERKITANSLIVKKLSPVDHALTLIPWPTLLTRKPRRYVARKNRQDRKEDERFLDSYGQKTC